MKLHIYTLLLLATISSCTSNSDKQNNPAENELNQWHLFKSKGKVKTFTMIEYPAVKKGDEYITKDDSFYSTHIEYDSLGNTSKSVSSDPYFGAITKIVHTDLLTHDLITTSAYEDGALAYKAKTFKHKDTFVIELFDSTGKLEERRTLIQNASKLNELDEVKIFRDTLVAHLITKSTYDHNENIKSESTNNVFQGKIYANTHTYTHLKLDSLKNPIESLRIAADGEVYLIKYKYTYY